MNTINTEKIPIKTWASILEDNALDQAKNLANLPSATLWVALMADTHLGFGMPIGGVLATQGVVIPNAVGVDIGCGMNARKTNLSDIEPETLNKVLNQIQRDVPNGYAHHKQAQAVPETLTELSTLTLEKIPSLSKIIDQMPFQIGTLGGGNHFIELQTGDDGQIWIMLHSGSRGIGKMVCNMFNDLAVAQNPDSFEVKTDLAGLALDSKEGQNYMLAMKLAMSFAEANRMAMLDKIIQAMARYIPELKVEAAIDTHHNYASVETHQGQEVVVHRKGAVRAIGQVIIPGSMGTFSYIGQGLENPESFCSCSHGAGRLMGRKEAIKTFPVQQVIEEMRAKNIKLFKQKKHDVAEESSGAYKDIDQVMKDQVDLVKPLVKLRPIGVVKG